MKNLNICLIDNSMSFKQDHFSKKGQKSHNEKFNEKWDAEEDKNNFKRIAETTRNARGHQADIDDN